MQLKRCATGFACHYRLQKLVTLDPIHLSNSTVAQEYDSAICLFSWGMKKSAYLSHRSSSALTVHQHTSTPPINNGTNHLSMTNKQKIRTNTNSFSARESPSKVPRLWRPEVGNDRFTTANNVCILNKMNPSLDKVAAHLTANLTPLSDQSPVSSPRGSYECARYPTKRRISGSAIIPTHPSEKHELSNEWHHINKPLTNRQLITLVNVTDEQSGDYIPGLDLPLMFTPEEIGEDMAPRLDLISRFSGTPSTGSSGFSALAAAVGSRCDSTASTSASCSAMHDHGGAGDRVGDSNRSVRGEEEGGVTVDGMSSNRAVPTATTTRIDPTATQRPASAHTSPVTVPSVGVELSKTAKARYAHLRQQHNHLQPVQRQPLPALHLHLSKDGSSPLPPGWQRAPNVKSRLETSGNVAPPQDDTHATSSTDHLYPYYYYHVRTRQTRWDPPVYPWDADPNDDGLGNPEAKFADDDPEAPYNWGCASKYSVSHDDIELMYTRIRHRMLERQCTELLHELAGDPDAPKGALEQVFAIELFTFVHNTLRTFRDARCRMGRIVNDEDLYYLTKKLSQAVILKEIQKLHQVQSASLFAVNPEVNTTVRARVSIYVRKYMESKGAFYRRRVQQPMPCGPSQVHHAPPPPTGHHPRPTGTSASAHNNPHNHYYSHHHNHHHHNQQPGGRANHRLFLPVAQSYTGGGKPPV